MTDIGRRGSEVNLHTRENTTFNPHRAGLQPNRKQEIPTFAEKGMQNAMGLSSDIEVTSLGDGKFDLQHKTQEHLPYTLDLRTADKRELNQYGYDVAKQAVVESVADIHGITDLNDLQDNIRGVRKVDGVWSYKYDHGDEKGFIEHKLDLNEIQDPAVRKRWEDHLEKTEQEITNLGLPIRDRYDMSDRLENAVLEDAHEKGMSADGTIHHYENGKWYMVEEGNGVEKIKEYTLDNDKIERKAGEDYLLNEDVRNKNGERITDVRHVDEKGLALPKNVFEVQYGGSDKWEKLKVADLDELHRKNFSTETELGRVTYNLHDALDNRKYFSDLGEVDDVLEDKKDALAAYRTRMRWTIRALKVMSFANTGAGQAAYNVDAAVEQLLHMGGNPNQPQELATTKGSEAVINYADKRYQNNKKFMRREISLVKRFNEENLPVHLHGLEHTFRGMFNQDGTINKKGEEEWHKALDKHLKDIDDNKLWQ